MDEALTTPPCEKLFLSTYRGGVDVLGNRKNFSPIGIRTLARPISILVPIPTGLLQVHIEKYKTKKAIPGFVIRNICSAIRCVKIKFHLHLISVF